MTVDILEIRWAMVRFDEMVPLFLGEWHGKAIFEHMDFWGCGKAGT